MTEEPSAVPSRRRPHWKRLAAAAVVAALGTAYLAWPGDGDKVAVQAAGRAAEEPAPGGADDLVPTTAAPTPTSATTTAAQPTGRAPSSTTSTTSHRPLPTTVTSLPAGTLVPVPATLLPAPPTTTTRAVNPLAPRARSMSVSPKEIDTSAGPATVTVRLRVTDDQGDAQMTSGTVRFAAVNSEAQVRDVPYEAWKLVAGDGYDGTYEASLTLWQHSAAGLWRFDHVLLRDAAGNFQYQFVNELPDGDFDDWFTQTGLGDGEAPDLIGFSFTPSSVDLAQGPPQVTFTARITDPIAGVATTMTYRFGCSVVVTSPSGQTFFAHMSYRELVAGDAHDATYRSVLALPVDPERGVWHIGQVHLGDEVGNQTNIWTDDLTRAGFPSSFTVTG